MFSLIVTGTPSSGESGFFARQRDSDAAAAASAASRATRYITFSFGSQRSIRSRQARATSTGDRSPLAYRRSISAADRSFNAPIVPPSYNRGPMKRLLFSILTFACLHSTALAQQEIQLW